MKVLVINAGSSSLKYQLIEMDNGEVIARGLCERIGESHSVIEYRKFEEKKNKEDTIFPDHKVAFEKVLNVLISGPTKVIDSLDEVYAIGHRIVHGKDFVEPTYVTDEVMVELENIIDYAPLHTPGAISVIRACRELMPDTPSVLVFDTAFHNTMPIEAKTYAIPTKLAKKYGIKRYGAHGSSHRYCAEEVAKLIGTNKFNLLNCHIGSGASLCAIKDGKCIDTSMGFTPLAGVVMGKRSGDVDPSIVSFICNKEGISAQEMIDILNNKSGFFGMTTFNDSRDVEEGMIAGNEDCKLAFDTFILSILRYMGAYIAELGGVDVINFTAGIGENSPLTRAALLDRLDFLGIKYDKKKNDETWKKGEPVEISLPESKARVFVIPTNEEIIIARDTLDVVKNLNK